jgi:hypothetical protein
MVLDNWIWFVLFLWSSDGYQCMTSYAASLPVVLHHPLNSGIELDIFVTNKQMTPPRWQCLIFS